MAGRALKWTTNAENDLNEILAFYQERNGNSEYGNKLLDRIEILMSNVVAHPYSGERRGKGRFRFVVVEPYQLFYRVTKTEIVVVTVWDGRRDPEALNLNG